MEAALKVVQFVEHSALHALSLAPSRGAASRAAGQPGRVTIEHDWVKIIILGLR